MIRHFLLISYLAVSIISCTKTEKKYPYDYHPDFDDMEEVTRTYIYSNSSFTEIDLNEQIIEDNLQSLKTIIKGEDPIIQLPEVSFKRRSEEILVISRIYDNDTMSFEVAYPFGSSTGAGISYDQNRDEFKIYYHIVFEPRGFPDIEVYVIEDYESYLNKEWGPKLSEGDEITYIGLYVPFKAEN